MPWPHWMLRRPAVATDAATVAAFDAVFAEAVRVGPDVPIDYRLAAPTWQFLCHLADTGRVVLHGSGYGGITEFELRQAVDVGEFGAQRGVYAATDGIWPLFFAVVDRDNRAGLLSNSCVRYGDPPVPGYFFSRDADRLGPDAWRDGWVYLLPPETFLDETIDPDGDTPVASAQCFSAVPVVPLARLAVSPTDFPFLGQVRGHDPEEVLRRAAADPQGFPWLDPV